MAAPARQRTDLAALRRRAAEERIRASRAAELADEYAARAADAPRRLRDVLSRAADLHYQMHARHLAAALLHETYASHMEQHVDGTPPFMAAVAEALGVPGATAVLVSQRSRVPVMVAASDATAQAAYDLESSAREGPAAAAVAEGTPLRAAGPALSGRWPRFGTAAARLGIQAVTAIPLRVPAARLGALCCYQSSHDPEDIMTAADAMGAALTPILLRAAPAPSLATLIATP